MPTPRQQVANPHVNQYGGWLLLVVQLYKYTSVCCLARSSDLVLHEIRLAMAASGRGTSEAIPHTDLPR